MRKRQQRELQRLEEALMETEYTQTYTEDELDVLDETWQQTGNADYDMYNTDDTDVDLDEYSEDVYRERSGRGLGTVITMLAMILLSVCILLLLKVLGVL